MVLNRRHAIGVVGGVIGTWSTGAIGADAYPTRPIRLVVPFPAGGPADIIGRTAGQAITASLGQPVVLDNIAGANGNIGSAVVAKAPADGYTLVVGNIGTHAINAQVYKGMPYDPVRDFTPICALIAPLMCVAVHPSVPAQSIGELIAHAKRNPGKLGYASSGVASPHHLAGALLCQLAGIEMVHVPYKGGAPASIDLVGGQVPVGCISLATVLPFHRAGKARILGMMERTRTPLLPDIPSISETVKGFEMNNWQGIFGPAKLDAGVVASLQAACIKGFTNPATKEQMESQGLGVIVDTAERFSSLVVRENEKWAKFVKAMNVSLE